MIEIEYCEIEKPDFKPVKIQVTLTHYDCLIAFKSMVESDKPKSKRTKAIKKELKKKLLEITNEIEGKYLSDGN